LNAIPPNPPEVQAPAQNEPQEPARNEQQQIAAAPPIQTPEPTPPTGRRLAFKEVRRELTNEDLASPGAQKLLLDALERADAECETLRSYVSQFHEADKRAAVLAEKLKPQKALDVAFGVGTGLGGAVVGLAPVFWDAHLALGIAALIVGSLLVIGGIVTRSVKG
jgi:hypothetical protein